MEECGTWSSGSDDRGTPCKTPAGEIAGDLDANATTNAGDGEPGDIVTSIAGAGKGVQTSGFATSVGTEEKPKRRMPPPGMMRTDAGQLIFTPKDVPADIPDVMMLDASRSEDAQEGDSELNLLATSADENGEDEGKAPSMEDPVMADDGDDYAGVGDNVGTDAVGMDPGEFSEDVIDDEDMDEDMDEDLDEDLGEDAPSHTRGYSPEVKKLTCGAYGDEC